MPAQTIISDAAFFQENDTAPPLRRQLVQFVNGVAVPIDLTDADTVTLTMSYARYSHYYSPFPKKVDRANCSIEDPRSDGYVRWSPAPGDLSPPGTYHYVFEVNWSDGTRQTVPSNTYETLIVKTKPGGQELS